MSKMGREAFKLQELEWHKEKWKLRELEQRTEEVDKIVSDHLKETTDSRGI